MERDKLLAGSEIFEYLASQGLKDLKCVTEAEVSLAEAEVGQADIRESIRFAACLVGFYREVFFTSGQDSLDIMFSSERRRGVVVGYFPDVPEGYLIFANGFNDEIGKRLREMHDYGRFITEEGLMVGMAVSPLRHHLLFEDRVKPIKRSDHLKAKDPFLRETIKLYDAEVYCSDNPLPNLMSEEWLAMEFDTMVIETVALHRLEWGVTLDELAALVKMEIRL